MNNCEERNGVSGSVNSSGHPWWSYLLWVLLAAVIGFSVAAVFAGVLETPREWYLAVYLPAIAAVIWAYFRWCGVDVCKVFMDYWAAGVLVGAIVSVFTIRTVLMQDPSDAPEGVSLATNLVWLGVAYGVVDALLLSVLPVHATLKVLEARGWTGGRCNRVAGGLLAIVVSMFVIGLYHIGYPECREPEVMVIIVGVAVQSLGYVVSRSPLSPIISHVAMHVAAVLHGINSVSQLPPHC